jgi:adenylate cyclase
MAEERQEQQPTPTPARLRQAGTEVAVAAKRLDRHPRLVSVAKLVRELLPGDSRFGDPLSTAGSKQAQLVGRRISELTAARPGVMREAGLSALQVLQAMSEAQGRGCGEQELAIVFTDLVEFSTWALQVGDDLALELLRDVGEAIEPPLREHGGEVVKRLGDGLMVVFAEPQQALPALLEARERLTAVQAPGYQPHIRAGMHVGKPRKLGGDYLGVDVNIAARVAEEAAADELLVSDRALAVLDTSALNVGRKRLFQVKGVPRDLETYAVAPRY